MKRTLILLTTCLLVTFLSFTNQTVSGQFSEFASDVTLGTAVHNLFAASDETIMIAGALRAGAALTHGTQILAD